MGIRRGVAPCAIAAAALAAAPVSAFPFLHDQSDLSLAGGASSLIDFVIASDFTLPAAAPLNGATAFIGDGSLTPDGIFTNSCGTLSRAIDDEGASGRPGDLIASGTDSSPVVVDTGLEDSFRDDVFRVTIELTNPVSLPSVTCWLALHEGVWGSAHDESSVSRAHPTSSFGASPRGDDNESSPSTWRSIGSEIGFTLRHDLIYATGFEAGVTCARSPITGGSSCPWAHKVMAPWPGEDASVRAAAADCLSGGTGGRLRGPSRILHNKIPSA